MEYRNQTYNKFGTIDCEINHPDYGWIPFTADRNDTGAEFDVAAMVGTMEADGVADYVAPQPPDPAIARSQIPTLSFAQLLTGLVEMEWITEAEGMDWLKGVALPAEITALITGLPAEVRFGTTARAMRMSEAVRNDPLVNALASVRGISPEDIDLFFNTFSKV